MKNTLNSEELTTYIEVAAGDMFNKLPDNVYITHSDQIRTESANEIASSFTTWLKNPKRQPWDIVEQQNMRYQIPKDISTITHNLTPDMATAVAIVHAHTIYELSAIAHLCFTARSSFGYIPKPGEIIPMVRLLYTVTKFCDDAGLSIYSSGAAAALEYCVKRLQEMP